MSFEMKKKRGTIYLASAAIALAVSLGAGQGLAHADETSQTKTNQTVSQSAATDHDTATDQAKRQAASQSTASAQSATASSSSSDVKAANAPADQQPAATDNNQANTADQNKQNQQNNQVQTEDPRQKALDKFASEHVSGYIYSPDVSTANGGYNWFEDGQLFTGFRYYTGTYYWFVNGVRQNAGWRQAWGYTYYTDNDGRAVQGNQTIDGQEFNFGNDGTYYLRSTGYLYDGSSQNGGYRWYEDGKLYTGFRYYANTYYWFIDGVRQNAGWREAWGYKYYTDNDGRAVQGTQIIDGRAHYFGDDNTFYERPLQGYIWDGSPQNGGYRWYENGELFTGFRYYTGTYYWFIDGVRQNAGWREAWGYTYYTDGDGRAVSGRQWVDGAEHFFGNDNTYYERRSTFFTDGGNIYYANGDGNIVTDWQTIDGRSVHFWADGRLDTDSVNIDFGHWSLDQRALGAPEGCEGVSFQMALSAKGKSVPDIHDIYNRIGYGFGVSPYDGFHGNPFGYGQWYTQTVLAAPLAAKLNGAYGVETKDITGAGVGDVLSQLMANNLVITYLPWNLQLNNASNNFHVQLIYGYRDGGFLIADPLTIARGANYWLSTSDWAYLNANVQPVGYGAPASMNVAVI
ncbi:C39 family peptidase [Fructobacillus fructosus]|uniref:C39 family peptidase n=1 Tax=Fructobacillus fructosus TaxID=1631 RepID=UPI002D9E690C|nr:Glucan-binding domain (YG repeat) [Fructobacillus fructosus]CAK1224489.1 Glucan-binding domain (YG repeat) [Fructobacillus fructosus]CAK1224692.1 Glucan-binding domain (YG repeat) [Fructobacillus fructosus]